MTDIVDRLRALNADFLHEEAADEIERLRAALRRIAHSADYDTIVSPDGDRHQRAIQIALEALTEAAR